MDSSEPLELLELKVLLKELVVWNCLKEENLEEGWAKVDVTGIVVFSKVKCKVVGSSTCSVSVVLNGYEFHDSGDVHTEVLLV